MGEKQTIEISQQTTPHVSLTNVKENLPKERYISSRMPNKTQRTLSILKVWFFSLRVS